MTREEEHDRRRMTMAREGEPWQYKENYDRRRRIMTRK